MGKTGALILVLVLAASPGIRAGDTAYSEVGRIHRLAPELDALLPLVLRRVPEELLPDLLVHGAAHVLWLHNPHPAPKPPSS